MLAFAQVALLRLFRERSNLFFVLLFPFLLVLLIGVSFGGSVQQNLGVVVADEEGQTPLVDGLRDEGLTVTRYPDADAARAAVADELELAAVVLPGQGGTRTSWIGTPGGGDRDLRIRVGAVLAEAGVTERARQALAALGVEDPAASIAVVGDVEDFGPGLTTTTVGDDTLDDEFAGLGQFDLGASSQLLLFVFITSLTGSVTLIQIRQWGIVDRVLAGPTAPSTALAGMALGQFAIALVQALVVVFGTLVVFDVNWGDPLATGAVVLLFSAVATAAGMLVGALADNEALASGIGVPLALVLAALGGSMLPLELFPDALVPVANASPHAWGNRAFAEIVRRGAGVGGVLPDLAALTAFAIVLGGLATVAFRRRLVH